MENDPDLEKHWERQQIVITAIYAVVFVAAVGAVLVAIFW